MNEDADVMIVGAAEACINSLAFTGFSRCPLHALQSLSLTLSNFQDEGIGQQLD